MVAKKSSAFAFLLFHGNSVSDGDAEGAVVRLFVNSVFSKHVTRLVDVGKSKIKACVNRQSVAEIIGHTEGYGEVKGFVVLVFEL